MLKQSGIRCNGYAVLFDAYYWRFFNINCEYDLNYFFFKQCIMSTFRYLRIYGKHQIFAPSVVLTTIINLGNCLPDLITNSRYSCELQANKLRCFVQCKNTPGETENE